MLDLTKIFLADQINVTQILGVWPTRTQFITIAVVALFVFIATATRKGGRRCSNCQESNRPNANYCAQCGQSLKKS